jgi:hypothetical protein
VRVDGQVMYAVKFLLFLRTFRHNVQPPGYQTLRGSQFRLYDILRSSFTIH